MKKSIIFIATLVLLLSVFASTAFAAEKSFTDVPKKHWAHDWIADLTEQGIIDGVGSGKFNPNGNVTRAEFAKLLVVMTDVKREKSGAYSNDIAMTFTDVSEGKWYYEFVKTAVDRGIVPNGENLQPEGAITREEVAIWGANAISYSYKEHYTLNPSYAASFKVLFDDHQTLSAEGQTALEFLGSTQVIIGSPSKDGNVYFNPSQNITRAESAIVLGRILYFSYQF